MDPFQTPGIFSWCELKTSDPAAAATFYASLFGWKINQMGPEMGGYRVVAVGEAAIGGIAGFMPGSPPMPPHWGAYVTVADADATAAQCTALGGKVLVPPMDIPTVGRMVVLQDPQGAVISAMAYQRPA